tara:strand:+ start:760 stop:1569 length:810 start_codon:yes stop_codon:yes gene_type:complete
MLNLLIDSFKSTIRDILPIILVIAFFQIVALRKKIPNINQIAAGFMMVIIGLSIFLVGLEKGIFPIGTQMANQLSNIEFLSGGQIKANGGLNTQISPSLYLWVYIFSFMIGFATTMAEPALIAVALKAKEISTGAISALGLRIAVALGVAIGISMGAYRIVTGTPLYIYIITGYVFLLTQTYFAPRQFVPLAYDCGGVTTSTVTVPLVAALGIGLATNVPGRSPLIDGFGLIAFASLFPMMTVLGYAMITERIAKRSKEISPTPSNSKS